MVRKYQELIVWQKAMELVTAVYQYSREFPKAEIYGLTGQLRRCAVSIPSNIAEGQGRLSTGGFLQFLGHSRASLFELETQVADRQQPGLLDARRPPATAGPSRRGGSPLEWTNRVTQEIMGRTGH